MTRPSEVKKVVEKVELIGTSENKAHFKDQRKRVFPTPQKIMRNRRETNFSKDQKETDSSKNQKETDSSRNRKENSFSRDRRENNFSRNRKENNFSRNRKENNFSRDRRENNFSGDRRENNFSGDRRENNFSRDRRENNFSRDRRENNFSRDRRENNFSGNQRENNFSRDRRENSELSATLGEGISENELEIGVFVLPGELVGTTEEFRAGTGTAVHSGDIYSTVTGCVGIDRKARIVSVLPSTNTPNILKAGDIIFGKVTDVRESGAMVEIAGIDGKIGREIVNIRTGDLHVSNVRDSYVKRLDSEFRPLDLIRAKVLDAGRMRLTTAEDSLGVMKAYCSSCRGELELDGKKLKCPVCNKTETRKISSEYGKGIQ